MLLIIVLTVLLLFIVNDIDTINCSFLNDTEIYEIIKEDNNNYFNSMSNINLQLRNITNVKNFLLNAKKHFYTLNCNEEKIIMNAIKKANRKLKNKKLIGFNYNKFKKYKWTIACSKGDEFEFGFPHTYYDNINGGIIILNYKNIYDRDLYKTLIHERVHIYQKIYKEDIKNFLDYFNFKLVREYNENNLCNPDTDLNIYKCSNIIFECVINNNLQKKYTYDSSIYEHPYEFMAYIIALECN